MPGHRKSKDKAWATLFKGFLYFRCPWHAIALKQFLLNALLIAVESLERHFNGNDSGQRGVCAMLERKLISALSKCRPFPALLRTANYT